MRFVIENNKPYLCSGGRVYPVEISEDGVRIDKDESVLSEQEGTYCLQEVVSKLGPNASSIQKKRRKKQEE